MQRVNSENGSYKCTPPDHTSHALQSKKKKDNSDSVKEHISKVMPACLQAVKLGVEHVRDRGQRMPIFGVNVGECPDNIGKAEATRYSGILIHITRVIVVNEIVPERLAKNRPSQRYKNDANAESEPPAPGPMRSYRLSSDSLHASPRIRVTSTITQCE